VQLGASGLYGRTADGPRASYIGVDAKYTPARLSHALVTVGGELIFSHRKVAVGDEADATEALGRSTRARWRPH
jgi:hypothetical protein